jgi:hypothetical protein
MRQRYLGLNPFQSKCSVELAKNGDLTQIGEPLSKDRVNPSKVSSAERVPPPILRLLLMIRKSVLRQPYRRQSVGPGTDHDGIIEIFSGMFCGATCYVRQPSIPPQSLEKAAFIGASH